MSPEYRTALFRALLSAVLVGASGFLAVWATTDDTKTLIIAAAAPAIATLMARFGVEGSVDARAARRSEGTGNGGDSWVRSDTAGEIARRRDGSP